MTKRPALDLHQAVTDKIVAAIEAGVGDARLPWQRPGLSTLLPKNAHTGNAYNGINILSLWAEAQVASYPVSLWGTYRQWQELGAQVRKGEKAALVIFYKQYEVEPDPADDIDNGQRRVAKASWVFNVAQVDGYDLPEIQERPLIVRRTEAEALLAHSGVPIVVGGDQAYYRPSTDTIHMPDERLFDASTDEERADDWYSVVFHEAAHATGVQKRLNRELGKRFGDQGYCIEELVAELASAMLMAQMGFSAQPRADHAQYIAHWLAVLKADKKAIFAAAARSQEAVAYLLTRQPSG
jgi:antirestriction protein ArdC